MVDLSKYFTEDRVTYAAQGIVLYNFDNTKKADFIRDMIVSVRDAYISNEKIAELENSVHKTRQELIQRRLPKEIDIISGDFGEILTFHIATAHFASNANIKVKKWRFKDDKTKASPKTDILLFYKSPDMQFSPEDTMYSIEVKTFASDPYNSKSAILNAVKDADVDRTSRAIETIDYFLTRIEDTGEYIEHYTDIERFGGAYNQHCNKSFNAVAIIDSTYLSKHIANIPESMYADYQGIDIYCLPMEELYNTYVAVYQQVPTQG